MKSKAQAKKVGTVDNFNVFYWVSWKPEMKKSWIVMHPGASMNHSSLQGLERGLNEAGHPTILLDQRGIGYSGVPAEVANFSLDKYSSDLQRIIEQEGLEKPDFFTHSFGFIVASDYIARTKNSGKLTATAATPNPMETADPLLLKYGVKIRETLFPTIYQTNLLINKILGKKVEYNDQDLVGRSDLKVARSLLDVSANEFGVYSANDASLRYWNITDTLREISVPLHLIYGREDGIVQPKAGKMIRELVKGQCDISLVKGTHTLPTAYPERILEVMKYK